MYLLDTDVVSALRRPEKNSPVSKWSKSVPARNLYLSTATIMEIQKGIALKRKKDALYADILTRWLDGLISNFEERILPITTLVARRWAELAAMIGHEELDLAIAATALEYELTVVTRNVRDFLPTGVGIFDPFAGKRHRPG